MAIEPNLSCGRCERCLAGHYVSCHSLMPPGAPPAYGFTPTDVGHGFWADTATTCTCMSARSCTGFQKSMPLRFASLYQPLAAGVRWAVQLPATRLGNSILILGHGQRGLGSVVAGRRAGASLIIVTGNSRSKRKSELARALGAHHVIAADVEDVVARVGEITGGRGVDVIVDTVPVATKPIIDAIEVARPGATLILAGIKGPVGVLLNVDRLLYKELHVIGVYSQGYEAYREAFRILDEQPLELAGMHTHEYPLERADEALRVFGRELATAADPICMTLHPDPTTMSALEGGTV